MFFFLHSTSAKAVGSGNESELDVRRREAFHPYFEIKSNLTNILKDFTELDSSYKRNTYVFMYYCVGRTRVGELIIEILNMKLICNSGSYKSAGTPATTAQQQQQAEPAPLSTQRDWNKEFQVLSPSLFALHPLCFFILHLLFIYFHYLN